MKMTRFLSIVALAALTAGAFPYHIHAGKLTALERTTDAQTFVDIAEALKANDSKPANTVPDYMRKSVAPEEGNLFVILAVSIEDGRTLSIADYLLSADGIDYPCMGITPQKLDFFDPRRFKVNGPQEVKLLFQCSATSETCDLLPSSGFPLAPVKELVLIQKAPEPAPAEQAAPEATPEAAPATETAAPAEGAAPAEAPAAAEAAAPEPAAPAPAAPAAAPAPAAEAAPAAAKPAAAEAEPPKPAPKPAPKPKQEEESWF